MFDQTQSEMIDGLLLGDASIPAGQNLFYFGQCKDRREYVKYVANQMGLSTDRVRSRKRKADSRTGKSYHCSELRTLSDSYFAHLRERWYPDGIKRVPDDLSLSSQCVLHWFLCDGSASMTRNSAQLVLCCDAFEKLDLERLSHLLNEVNITSTILRQRRIRIRQESIQHFYDYIGKCPVSCLEYKWLPKQNRASRQKRLQPHYDEIYDLYRNHKWSCSRIAKKFESNYFSIRYVLKTHFGISFGKNATTETTCREGVVAPSETARRAPVIHR